MFSFFKRAKTKEEGDKKDKAKEKSTFSPFAKRQDSVKKGTSVSNQETTSPLSFSRLSTGLSSPQISTQDDHSSSVPQQSKTPPHSASSGDRRTKQHNEIYLDANPVLPALVDSSVFANVEGATPTAFERDGSGDRAESDSVFKTAPNTPDLTKHLTSVLGEVLTDSPFPVTEPLGRVSFRTDSHASREPPRSEEDPSVDDIYKDINKPHQSSPKSLHNVKELPSYCTDTSLYDTDKNRTEIPVDVGDPDETPTKSHLQTVSPVTEHFHSGPLGENLDFPVVDEEECTVTESEASISQEVSRGIESKGRVVDEELDRCKREDTQESDRFITMSQRPGELYDIVEEDTSEEQSEDDQAEAEEDDDDDDDSGNVTQPTIEEEYPEEIFEKTLVNPEAPSHLQERVHELNARLSAREAKLLCQIDNLQYQVMVKTGGMDRVQAELNAAHKESELVRNRLHKLEEDLHIIKERNTELTEELQNRTEPQREDDGFDFNRLLELEQEVKVLAGRVKELESQLEHVRQERDRLEQEVKQLADEREEEKRLVKQALEDSMTEKKEIQDRFEKDFEKLRTVNTDREQQLLDDFEWKLREVEQACKRRLEEKEKQATLRVQTAEDKLKAVEEDLTQLERLKQYEAEALQLRGLNLEQQRALRFAERTKEQLQVSEKVLQEELKKLQELLNKEKAALTTMQGIHNREIDEKERKIRFRLEQQKAELNTQWEEKLTKETIRLKVELDQVYRDERRLMLEAATVEKEGEMQKAIQAWERKFQGLEKEVDVLKQRLVDEEEEHRRTIETVQTNSDRDIFDLRRKLDKIDISYQEKIEKLQSSHDREKGILLEEHEQKLQTCEQSWQMQLSSTRATLELVKEQLKREAAEQQEVLHENHRCQLEEQWEQLMQERDEALAMAERRHTESMDTMRKELEDTLKSREHELVDGISHMRPILRMESQSGEPTVEEAVRSTIQDLKQKIVSQDEHLKHTQEDAHQKLRLMEEGHRQACSQLSTSYSNELSLWKNSAEELQAKVTQLSKQLEDSKNIQLVEKLRTALSEKEQQLVQLSKERHMYQLELMNRNCNGQAVTARHRRKGSRGKPGHSRGHK